MSYEMYEDFKETMVKTIKTELAAKTANNNQSSDNDLSQRLEQIVYTEQERHQAIIINQVTMTCRNDWSKSYIQNKSGIRR